MEIEEIKYKNNKKEYRSSDHIVFSCQYHVIFCPKYRRKILKSPYDARLKEMFQTVADRYQFKIIEMEIMPDHVHLLIDCDPRFGICECIKKLKGYTATNLVKEFPEIKHKLPCVWTKSYFVSSVGSVSLEVVKQYIENQKGK